MEGGVGTHEGGDQQRLQLAVAAATTGEMMSCGQMQQQQEEGMEEQLWRGQERLGDVELGWISKAVSKRIHHIANKLQQMKPKRKRSARAPRLPLCRSRIPIPPPPPPREVDMSKVELLIEKRLKYSDVKEEGRIIIPKALAEKYLPKVDDKEGFFLFMDDVKEVKLWMFRFRFWPNCQRRVYVLENAGEFVKAYSLQSGDFIMIYKDNQTERYAIHARKAPAAHMGQDAVNLSSADGDAEDARKASCNLLENGPGNEVGDYYPDMNFATAAAQTADCYHSDFMVDIPMELLNMDSSDLLQL